MTLSDISIKNPVFAWMLMAALILFGWIGFLRMGVSELPDVDIPMVTVELSLEGAAPEVMESDVVDVVEDAVMGVQGIKEVTSSCREGSATVTIEFDLKRDIDVALQDVQTKVAQAQKRLPEDIDPAVVTKFNPEDQPIMWLALSGDMPIRELMEYTRNTLKDQFQTVSGVGEIFLGGYTDPNLRIWLDLKKLEEYELTVDDILQAINRGHVELPAGRIETSEKEFNVRAMGEAVSPKEFENIVIPERGGAPIHRPIFLKDVARVESGLADLRRISRVMGKPAIGLGIRKQRGANAVEVAHGVKKRMEEIKKFLPAGLSLGVNFDSTKFVEESVGELKFTLLLSAILTGIVCWLFLGAWSSTLNILFAIPTSVVGTFLVLYFCGFTLNNMTLLGLALAIGIVVDDAILVLENITRHQEKGEDKVEAARLGAREITFAALASTLAIIAVFSPVAFMSGVIGKFFFQFGVTLSVAVILSLFEALTFTPMRCSQFVSVAKRRTKIGKKMDLWMDEGQKIYHRFLISCLDHRGKVMIGALIVFALSFGLLPFLRKEFVPVQDQSMLMARLQTPVGSSLPFTDSRLKQAEAVVMKRPEVDRYYSAVGGFGGGDVNTGMVFITLKPPDKRKLSQQEFMQEIRKELNAIPDLKATLQDFSTRGFMAGRGYPVEFTVRGADWGKLVEFSQKIKKAMEADPSFVDVDTDYQTNVPEVQVVPDRERAAQRGVAIDTIGRTVNAAIAGKVAGKFTEKGRRSDIRVRLEEEDRMKPEDIQRLFVRNNHGELIALKEVTTLAEHPSLLKITRKNRERAVGLTSNIARGESLTDVIAKVNRLAQQTLSEGYRIVFTGTTETFQESFRSLIFALVLGVIIAYMILASQFNHYLHPLTVLLALPFSLCGALIALLITGQSLNISSMIGLILLMGIVKKNSILLVDFTNKKRDEGFKVREALLEACPLRLRPILMTSISTIAAAVPAAINLGPGAESRIPMAIAVIGGVLVSTFLTLFVVPCAYSLLSRFERHPKNPSS